MIKVLKYLGIFLFSLILIFLILVGVTYVRFSMQSEKNMKLAGPEAPHLVENRVPYRDLNKNGNMDPYEDPTEDIALRVEDLLQQMTLEEKAGCLFISPIGVGNKGELLEEFTPTNPMGLMMGLNSELVLQKKLNHFNLFQVPKAIEMARWNNAIQKLAEKTRLGIPITLATDPRHGFSNNPATSMLAMDFSQWPEPLGLAAIGDSALTVRHADIARQEYLAVGFRQALHPMADLATEPRWARIFGTFGEDAHLAAKLTAAYIYGFQGDTLGPQSVSCMTKHFPGGGPQADGWDAHFSYGKDQVYPGDSFAYHLIPFEKGAFPAHTGQIMPYYGIPKGQGMEEVGFGFSKTILQDLLRDRYNFQGVVCTDWSLISEISILGLTFAEAKKWGLEDLPPKELIKRALEAGVDQFGGEKLPELVVELVKEGGISEQRINTSIRRLLRDKFTLGLFDDPYVELEEVYQTVGDLQFMAEGMEAQKRSLVLLKNETPSGNPILPLRTGRLKIYTENISSELLSRYGQPVETPEEADVAILRLATPYVPRTDDIMSRMFHQGDLDFKGKEKERILNILSKVPTVVDIYLDRAAVIPEIAAKSNGLIANFGASDEALLSVIFGEFNPQGKLPIELPQSMEAVYKQKEDVPYDSEEPLFPFGFGLSY